MTEVTDEKTIETSKVVQPRVKGDSRVNTQRNIMPRFGEHQKHSWLSNFSNSFSKKAFFRTKSFNQTQSLEPKRKGYMHIGIFLVVFVLLCYGLIMLFSASMTRSLTEGSEPTEYIIRQLTFTGIGIAALITLIWLNVKRLDRMSLAVIYYLICAVLLVAVLLVGTELNGQRRWLRLPFLGLFQPSEVAKVGVVYCMACYFSSLRRRRIHGAFKADNPKNQMWLDGFLDILFPMLCLGFLCLLISLQSHMSAVAIMVFLSFSMILISGPSWDSWKAGLTYLTTLALVAILIVSLLRPYLPDNFTDRWDHVMRRVNVFSTIIGTSEDKADEDDTYQTEQAFIAIGSGGLWGAGLGQGKQKHSYLPEGHNDYIFSNIVEELGFVGGAAIVLLFVLFLLMGLSVASRSLSLYDTLIASGTTFLITLQGLLSISVNVGLIPPTGISLPFFSYGGTSNIFFLVAVGLLLSVSKYRQIPKELSPLSLRLALFFPRLFGEDGFVASFKQNKVLKKQQKEARMEQIGLRKRSRRAIGQQDKEGSK